MEGPETRYAVAPDGTYLAYQVAGYGPLDVVWHVEYISSAEMEWERPFLGPLLQGLASFARVILHDQRGIGLSSRDVAPPDLETRASDLEVVLEAAEAERVTLVAASEGCAMNALFAAVQPQRVRSMVWFEPQVRNTWASDYPWGYTAEEIEVDDHALAAWGTPEFADLFREQQASRGHDISLEEAETLVRASRHACTPDMARAITRIWRDTDSRAVLPAVEVPTLILVDEEGGRASEESRYVASLMSASTVEILGPEGVMQPQLVVDRIRAFLGADRPAPSLDRVLATVLFTDIIGSTEHLARVGDATWREVLAQHDDQARALIDRLGGRYIVSTGDGLLATFDGPARAVRCAQELGDALSGLGIQIRSGVHTGEVEREGDDVRGLAVHIGARVAALAGPSEVLVSQTVKDLVAGSGLAFEDAGDHELKGVPDRWHLYRLVRGQ